VLDRWLFNQFCDSVWVGLDCTADLVGMCHTEGASDRGISRRLEEIPRCARNDDKGWVEEITRPVRCG
jgi:hypothetical protein